MEQGRYNKSTGGSQHTIGFCMDRLCTFETPQLFCLWFAHDADLFSVPLDAYLQRNRRMEQKNYIFPLMAQIHWITNVLICSVIFQKGLALVIVCCDKTEWQDILKKKKIGLLWSSVDWNDVLFAPFTTQEGEFLELDPGFWQFLVSLWWMPQFWDSLNYLKIQNGN